MTSLLDLTNKLNELILEKYGLEKEIDILGFSMGGIIGRYWLQKFNGYKRTRRLISIGSPHKGTLMAQLIPKYPFRGISEMKINSKFQIIKKSIFIKFRRKEGFPDGMTVDVNDNLWVCHYNGASISVYNLKGSKIHQIYLPVKNVTNCTFGGSKNDELFISTARKDMSAKELKKYPLSGSLFRVKTNMKGTKTTSFKILSSVF